MKKLNLIAPVGQTGYGVTGFNILKHLVELDWDVTLFPKGPHHRKNPSEIALINEAINKNKMFPHDAPCVNIWHQNDLSAKVGRGTYFGWPIFELDTFDAIEKHHLSYPDKIIVCSQWAREILWKNIKDIKYNRDIYPLHNNDWCERQKLDLIKVVPLGVDRNIFNSYKLKQHESKDVIFMNVGKWEVRKGHDILLSLFEKAFTPQDNVQLWLMPFNIFLSPGDRINWEHMYLDSVMGRAGKIKIFPWTESQQDVAHLMSQAHCGIFPARAEGWNLELLEMLALGKSVITIAYAAHNEFCHNRNAMLAHINKTESAYDGKWFFGQGNWACINEDVERQLIGFMRQAHQKYTTDPNYVNEKGIETSEKFTWRESARKLEEILLA